MPGGDGTGPLGTFRNCLPVDSAGNPIPVARPFFGRRFFGRAGFGGRGFRWRYYATGVPGGMWNQQQPQTPAASVSTKQMKDQEISFIEQEIGALKKRLEELKKEE